MSTWTKLAPHFATATCFTSLNSFADIWAWQSTKHIFSDSNLFSLQASAMFNFQCCYVLTSCMPHFTSPMSWGRTDFNFNKLFLGISGFGVTKTRAHPNNCDKGESQVLVINRVPMFLGVLHRRNSFLSKCTKRRPTKNSKD